MLYRLSFRQLKIKRLLNEILKCFFFLLKIKYFYLMTINHSKKLRH